MAIQSMVRPHGALVRGITLSPASQLFAGPFGRIFRALPPADFGSNEQQTQAALHTLAEAMVSTPDPADPKDAADNEESGIPAGFTYFGQFIDHDLTFDPASSLQKQNDPDALVDYRTPRFDLDNIYGRGPDDQPYMYLHDGISLKRGMPLTGAAANPHATDLVRSPGPDDKPEEHRAIIGDPRNDENVIVSQLQGIFHRFHNKVVADLQAGGVSSGNQFQLAQQIVRFHYQWILVNDFLPRIVSADVLNAVLPHLQKGTNIVVDKPVLNFYHAREFAFMPLEFSAAAYRFGHSMVRPGYRLNPGILVPIFSPDPVAKPSLTGFRKFPDDWAIDWNKFLPIDPRPAGSTNTDDPNNKLRMQLAYRMDTSLVDPLKTLPEVAFGRPIPSLAERNLLRGWRMRLPNGQDVARAMGIVPLADGNIKIGKFDTGDAKDLKGDIVSVAGAVFANNCPLWTYILAETVQDPTDARTRKLGPVGGRIVAETFVGLLLADNSSYFSMNPLWKPTSYAENGVFGLRELVKTALSVP
jgi:hypothetical protein